MRMSDPIRVQRMRKAAGGRLTRTGLRPVGSLGKLPHDSEPWRLRVRERCAVVCMGVILREVAEFARIRAYWAGGVQAQVGPRPEVWRLPLRALRESYAIHCDRWMRVSDS